MTVVVGSGKMQAAYKNAVFVVVHVCTLITYEIIYYSPAHALFITSSLIV